EEALALGEAPRRIGRRVEEDVDVVERRAEADVRRAKEPVPEDVAAHVTDAGDGERGRVRVDAELAEVRADAFPRAARRDAEPLVVVALGPTGREGVAEPEAPLDREPVRDVGE